MATGQCNPTGKDINAERLFRGDRTVHCLMTILLKGEVDIHFLATHKAI